MTTLFGIVAAIAILSTALVIVARNAIHALLYLVVSLLSVSVVLFLLGAPFAAATEVIIYAGAIMVLFVFAILMVNLGPKAAEAERIDLKPSRWGLPAGLSVLLLFVFLYAVFNPGLAVSPTAVVGPKKVGLALFGPYLILAELAGILLMTGVLGASYLGRRVSHE